MERFTRFSPLFLTLAAFTAFTAGRAEAQTCGDRTDFDANAYLACNADVRAAGVDACGHYLEYGRNEGRTWNCGATTGGGGGGGSGTYNNGEPIPGPEFFAQYPENTPTGACHRLARFGGAVILQKLGNPGGAAEVTGLMHTCAKASSIYSP